MTSAKKSFSLYAISEARNVLFGIATLWIGLFHANNLTLATYTDNWYISSAFRFFRSSGNAGVDIFLFLSGIGLYFSFAKDSRVGSFLKKRMMRVLPTALLIAVIYFSLRYVHGREEPILWEYLCRISFLEFFITGERVFWFISLILVLYLLFPPIYKAIEKFRIKGMLGLVALTLLVTFLLRALLPDIYANLEIALCRIPVFIIGVWAGRFVMEKKEIDRRWLWLFLGAALVMLAVMYKYTSIMKLLVPGYNKDMESMYIWLYRFAGTGLGVSLTVLLSFVCTELRHRGMANILRNFFEFVGVYSMEYYMIFLNLNHYLERVYKLKTEQEIMLYLGSFVISLALCVLARKACDFFMAQMQKKPANLQELKEARKKKRTDKR